MSINDCILDALENVLDQELPEVDLSEAIQAEAELLAGVGLDSID